MKLIKSSTGQYKNLKLSGDNIVNVRFVKKTTVKVDENGSILTLAPVEHADAGLIMTLFYEEFFTAFLN